MNHVKPTKEELELKAQQAIEEAEKLADTPIEEETPEEPKVEMIVEEEPEVVPEEKPVEEQAEPSEEEKVKLQEELEAKKKEISASARENQKIYAKNRVINKALIEAGDIPEPTEEELQGEYGDNWDLMSEIEKKLAKETVVSQNWRKKISEAKDQASKIEKWNESVEEFVDDPKTLIDNSELEGKTEDFKAFALEESNNSVPFKVLVGAFLHEQQKNSKQNKGKMFETALGGSNEKPTPKTDKISLEEARKLRETDFTKYKEMLVAGKIESDL